MIVLLEDELLIGCVSGRSINDCAFCYTKDDCLMQDIGFVSKGAREWLNLREKGNGKQL